MRLDTDDPEAFAEETMDIGIRIAAITAASQVHQRVSVIGERTAADAATTVVAVAKVFEGYIRGDQ